MSRRAFDWEAERIIAKAIVDSLFDHKAAPAARNVRTALRDHAQSQPIDLGDGVVVAKLVSSTLGPGLFRLAGTEGEGDRIEADNLQKSETQESG